MSTLFFLIPGLRLPKKTAADVLQHAHSNVRDALRFLGSGRGAPVAQRLVENPFFERTPHWCWLWKALARRSGDPLESAALWRVAGGPQLDRELALLRPVSIAESGAVDALTELADDELLPLVFALSPAVEAEGLRLFMCGNALFLSPANAKETLSLCAAPAHSLLGNGAPTWQEALRCGMTCRDAAKVARVLTSLEALLASSEKCAAINEKRVREGRPRISAFWASSAAKDESFYPPSRFRALLSDDPAVRGWALAAGIPAFRVKPFAKTLVWPDMPPGDAAAVLDDLYEPWLKGDWTEWEMRLPKVVERIEKLRESAKAKNLVFADELIVTFGAGGALTLPPQKSGFLSCVLSLRQKKGLDPALWLADQFLENTNSENAA